MPIKGELAKFSPQKETLISIGVFDGVHLGHQHLLNSLVQKANVRSCLSGVITFKSHPRWVLDTGIQIAWLNDLDMRINLLRNLGINIIIPIEFTYEISQLTARQFIKYLKEYLKLSGLVVGPDFALGKGREGTIERLRLLGQEMDISVDVVQPMILDDEVVSSSLIRQTLAQGDMKKVTKLLGRPFSYRSQVVPGDRRGHQTLPRGGPAHSPPWPPCHRRGPLSCAPLRCRRPSIVTSSRRRRRYRSRCPLHPNCPGSGRTSSFT